QHQHGHHAGGGGHAPGAGDRLGDELGGDGRGGDVDRVVAQQHRPDHGFLVVEQPVDPLGGEIALTLQLVHAAAAGAGQGGLGGGEQGGHRQQDDQGEA